MEMPFHKVIKYLQAPLGVDSPMSNLGFCSMTNQTSTPAVCEADERKMSTIRRDEM